LYTDTYIGFGEYAASFGTDVPRLKGTHKKYLYGPGSILSAHTEDEFIKIDDLVESIAAYKKIALHCLEQ
jgi:acetylornithine deacetylase/succinyl-diaminopimelate desuccinylase-like protein